MAFFVILHILIDETQWVKLTKIMKKFEKEIYIYNVDQTLYRSVHQVKHIVQI